MQTRFAVYRAVRDGSFLSVSMDIGPGKPMPDRYAECRNADDLRREADAMFATGSLPDGTYVVSAAKASKYERAFRGFDDASRALFRTLRNADGSPA
jgi:hypothetical protein